MVIEHTISCRLVDMQQDQLSPICAAYNNMTANYQAYKLDHPWFERTQCYSCLQRFLLAHSP